uniref:Cysteine proteinase inhibitor n=1 Tax=Opuntia streptacantha TaxID=393608 RepID=A0A7C9D3E3_OPUST
MNPKSPIFILLLFAIVDLGFCREFETVKLKKFGGISDFDIYRNNLRSEIDSIAHFAVQQHNRDANAFLEFGRVLKAKEQVVSGKIFHLTLEVIDAGKKAIYEAKVLVKPWLNSRQLQEFKLAVDVSHFTTSGLGITHGQLGWHKVPAHDPEIQDAANYALRTIQQRSNCHSPYQLLEILQAEAEAVEDYVKYNLLLKLSRGIKEEKLKVKVYRTAAGKFLLNMMEHHDM